MRTLRVLYHLAKADLLERVRRTSFAATVACTVMAGYFFVPPVEAGYRVLQVGGRRGIYNSAWVGLMFGLIAAMHLPLAGFFLTKNTIDRDRWTGAGQIIAGTPTSNAVYLLGKWLSNLALLGLILVVMTVMAAVMQLVRAEDLRLDLWALVAPIWLMGLPVLAIAAALAVLFESVSPLSGSLGNLAAFALWIIAIVSVVEASLQEGAAYAKATHDHMAYGRQLVDIQQQVLALDPDAQLGSGLITPSSGREDHLLWEGVSWGGGVILERLLWTAAAPLLAMAGALVFDRFDPARRRRFSQFLARPSRRGAEGPAEVGAGLADLTISPLAQAPTRVRWVSLLLAELKLTLRGHRALWYLGAIGLAVACLVSPMEEVVRPYLLLVLWLWPLPIWSAMGTRERRHNTGQLVFSTPRPVWRQLPACWLAGVIATILVGSGAWLRLLLVGDTAALAGYGVGALFSAALALALGVWTGGGRAFEAVYLLLWYVGPVNQVLFLDYAGVVAGGRESGMPAVYLGLTAGLFALALAGRMRQVRG